MQGVQNVGRGRLIAVELVGDVGLAVDRAAGGQRDDLALEGELDGVFQPQSHPADLLDEEFPAAGGALVVGKDIGNGAAGQKVNQEGLSAQRDDGIEIFPQFAQGAPNGRDLGQMAQLSRNAEKLRAGKLRLGQQRLEGFQGTAAMWRNPRLPPPVMQRHGLDRQGADVHTRAKHDLNLRRLHATRHDLIRSCKGQAAAETN